MKTSKQKKAVQELFDMVYSWGKWNVKANYHAPAFENKLEEVKKAYEIQS